MQMNYKDKLFKPLVLIIVLLIIAIFSLGNKSKGYEQELSSINERIFLEFSSDINELEEELGILLISNDEFFDTSKIDMKSTVACIEELKEIPVEDRKSYDFSPIFALEPLENILNELSTILKNESLSNDDLEFISETKKYLSSISRILKKSMDKFEDYSQINFYRVEFQKELFKSLLHYNRTEEFVSRYEFMNSEYAEKRPNYDATAKALYSLNREYLNEVIEGKGIIFTNPYTNAITFNNATEECNVFHNDISDGNTILNIDFKYNEHPSQKKNEKELIEIRDKYIENLKIENIYESITSFNEGLMSSYEKRQGDIVDKTKELRITLNEYGQLTRMSIFNIDEIYDNTPLVPKLSKEDVALRINEKYRERIEDIVIYNTYEGLIYEASIEGKQYTVRVGADTGEVLSESPKLK